jgi:hypothetical protein
LLRYHSDQHSSRSNLNSFWTRPIVQFFLTQGSINSINSFLLNFELLQRGFDSTYRLPLMTSAGILKWAALHHLMECFEAKPSFKLTYRKLSALSNGLTGFADSDWANSIFRRSTTCSLFLHNCLPISLLSKLHKSIALPTAEADSDGELLSINRGSCGDLSPIPPAAHGVCPTLNARIVVLVNRTWIPGYKDDSACNELSNNMVSITSEAENVPSTSTSGSTSPNGHLRPVRETRLQTSHPRDFISSLGLHAAALQVDSWREVGESVKEVDPHEGAQVEQSFKSSRFKFGPCEARHTRNGGF